MAYDLRAAYIGNYTGERDSVNEFAYILKYYCQRIGLDNFEEFEFSRKGYTKVAEVADDLIVQSLLSKKEAEKEKRRVVVANVGNPQEVYAEQAKQIESESEGDEKVRPRHPSIRDHNIDDFVEILVKIKEIVSSNWIFDELDQMREELLEEREALEFSKNGKEQITIRLPFGWVIIKEDILHGSNR